MNREINLELIKPVWQEMREYLDGKRRQIFDEIQNYPPPIPACDVQFNYLLEERTKLSQELNRLDTLFQQGLVAENPFQWIEEFMESSHYISGESEQKIRSFLMATRSKE